MKLSHRIKITILLLSSMLFAVSASASSVRQLDVNELLAGSELVFEGKVLSKQVRWNDAKTDIFTILTFSVEDVIHGAYAEPELTLSFVGGQIDDFSVKIEGSIIPDIGEHGVYFVESISISLVNPLLGWSQGHLKIQKDSAGVSRVFTADDAPVMGMDATMTKTQFISDGVMTGLKVGAKTQQKPVASQVSEAMTVKQLKGALKQQMQESGKPVK